MGITYRNGHRISTIPGTEPQLSYKIIDNTLPEYTNKIVNKVADYKFYNNKNLTKADLTGITEIGGYAFNGNTNLVNLTLDNNLFKIGDCSLMHCKKTNLTELSNSITEIGSYGCSYLNSNSSEFTFKPTNKILLHPYAFNYSKIKEFESDDCDIRNNSFYNCSSLTKVNIKVNGYLDSQCFSTINNITNFNLDKNSVVTILGSYAFREFGNKRTNPQDNKFTFDFRNSTFTEVGDYCFYGSSSYKNQYFDIYLPKTCSTVKNYVLQYTDHINLFLTKEGITTGGGSSIFSSATNCKVFVNYKYVNAQRTAANWTTAKDFMYGWAQENTFNNGDTLPVANVEGYTLTWYTDTDFTNEVTTVTDSTKALYCKVGTVRIAVELKKVTAYQASLAITDSAGKTYSQGDVILRNTVLTLTATPDAGNDVVYQFTVNGNNITSGSQYTVGEDDINITCIYYDGVNPPVIPTFAENSWSQIAVGFITGVGKTMWTVGDTKSDVLTDGTPFTLRYVDGQANRYEKADGSGYSQGLLEFTETMFQSQLNSSSSNVGGYPAMTVIHTNMQAFYDKLPADLKAIMKDYKWASSAGNTSSDIVYDTAKMAPLAEIELFGRTYYSKAGEGTVLDYYKDATNSKRVKYRVGTTSADACWTRSPYGSSTSNFVTVYYNGDYNYNYAHFASGVAPAIPIG